MKELVTWLIVIRKSVEGPSANLHDNAAAKLPDDHHSLAVTVTASPIASSESELGRSMPAGSIEAMRRVSRSKPSLCGCAGSFELP